MSLSKKQISSVVHLLNDTTQRLIDAVDNDATLTIQEISVMRNRLCKEICDINMDDILSVDKNARRLLLKRGSGAENNAYVGMSGEVTVDTDAKTLRVHDGTTAGGVQIARLSDLPEISSADYVVAWQNPTEQNNYTWYRKYKSGWVEQGQGLISINNSTTVLHTLPIEMANSNYTVVVTPNMNNSSTGGYSVGVDEMMSSSFKTRGPSAGSTHVNTFSWYVCGMGA